MDTVLTSSERRELCSLLELDPQLWGNIPVMRNCYKKSCLKYHPDKGGDGQKMVRLNELWARATENLTRLREDCGFQDEPPIYGTPAFREWWFYQQNLYTWSHDGPSTSSSSGRSRRWDSSRDHGEFAGGEGSSGRDRVHTSKSSTSMPSHRPHSSANLHGDNSEDPLFCEETLDSSPSPPPSPAADPHTFTSSQSSTPSSAFGFSSQTSTPSNASQGDSRTTGPHPNTPSPRRRKHREDHPTSPYASGGSFSSTPPKSKKPRDSFSPLDFPSDLLDCLSRATLSNKTQNAFLIFSTKEKVCLLYDKTDDKYKVEFKSLHKYKNGSGFLFIILLTKHRVTAIKNFCAQFCTISFLLCKAVIQPVQCYDRLCKDPYTFLKANKCGIFEGEFAEQKDPTCDWNQIADFALAHLLDDPLLILAHYLDFSKPPGNCTKCLTGKGLKAHADHAKEHDNAKLFIKSKSQKSICQQAADVVCAKKRLAMLEQTRTEMLEEKFRKQLAILKELEVIDLHLILGGVAWYSVMFQNFADMLKGLLQLFTDNIPKKRNALFIGPINSGKTSFAAALIDLLEGKALNINCPADKLNFELGCALDLFMVCFEDVKGSKCSNKDLQSGQGMNNLDNLRDHMDGAVPVQLERKHQNKRSQIFPPCIVTCNEYYIPGTVATRFAQTLTFAIKLCLKNSIEKNILMQQKRVLQRGCTLLMALIWLLPLDDFSDGIRSDVKDFKGAVEGDVGWATYQKMVENVENGDDPMKGILEQDNEQDNEDVDSGRFTQ
ncbi:large T antigen [Raccoon polyomavirus]|uniref:DNA 3'-5' helicase n=1 Tax=Raccoon polyomavirus TaxID=1219896 RepID=J7G6M5_9POLY|nr:large T antigen [Raccoon polyomavirus]AFP58019.1 large T antigen [Raccoon polyomavirus]AMB49039.1 large T antigen [Raccoon polyomavirus]